MEISSWNVNGLFRNINGTRYCKLDDKKFLDQLTSDIIILSETHTGNNESLQLDLQ